jgi:hypothetical protein
MVPTFAKHPGRISAASPPPPVSVVVSVGFSFSFATVRGAAREIAAKAYKHGAFSRCSVLVRAVARATKRILSPPRMPFRHPGAVEAKLSYQAAHCKTRT